MVSFKLLFTFHSEIWWHIHYANTRWRKYPFTSHEVCSKRLLIQKLFRYVRFTSMQVLRSVCSGTTPNYIVDFKFFLCSSTVQLLYFYDPNQVSIDVNVHIEQQILTCVPTNMHSRYIDNLAANLWSQTCINASQKQTRPSSAMATVATHLIG